LKAEFPGGEKNLANWLKKNLNYPVAALNYEIQGTVYVEFVVLLNGYVDSVKIIKSAHPILDKEVIDVVKKMPRWKTGVKNYEQVNTSVILPVAFKIENE
jgi:protein TonB